MGSTLHLSEETMAPILTKAILEGIGAEERDAVIAQAVAYLIKPQPNLYRGSEPRTPLQDAFDNAMRIFINTVVREFIETNPEVKAQVTEHLTTLLGQIGDQLHSNYELRDVVTNAVIGYFAERGRE